MVILSVKNIVMQIRGIKQHYAIGEKKVQTMVKADFIMPNQQMT
jgi:hypothetical protein